MGTVIIKPRSIQEKYGKMPFPASGKLCQKDPVETQFLDVGCSPFRFV